MSLPDCILLSYIVTVSVLESGMPIAVYSILQCDSNCITFAYVCCNQQSYMYIYHQHNYNYTVKYNKARWGKA